jgi:hypothetical protein
MNAIFGALAGWVLVQVFLVWFCTRLVGLREFQRKHWLEVDEHLACHALDAGDDETWPHATPVAVHAGPSERARR